MAVILKNDVLCLIIEEPGRIYKGSRFDHTGNISQVLMDGKSTFCTTESPRVFNPNSSGQGLYNEFGINKPVGYDDCMVGQKFLKIGVGLLTRKDDKPYNFFACYETSPFKYYFELDANQIVFTVLPEDCRGYSVKMIKTITLSASSFTIGYELKNTGTKRILTNEYCHNFISINQSAIGTPYTLTIPSRIMDESEMYEAVNPGKALTLTENTVKFLCTPGNDFFFSPLSKFQGTLGEWILGHESLGLAIKESTDFIPQLMNLWGTGHVISPELFYEIDIMPGETLKWRRNYELYHI